MYKKMFFLSLLAILIGGCATSSNKPTTPTARDAICADLKTQMLFSQTAPGGSYTSQNQLDPAKQAELMNTYQKYNCDQANQ